MSREEVTKILNGKNGKDYKMLLEFCKAARTGGEIMKVRVKKDVFAILVELKGKGAIAFTEGKYYTTPLGLEALG